jgi:nucleoside-diphosphate-sugar epimerase
LSTILVTGGAGYIGTVLTEELLAAGHKVICLDRVFFGMEVLKDFQANPNYTLVRDDVRRFDKSVLRGVDVVVSLAAISNDPACDLDPEVTKTINLDGTLRTARLAKEMGVGRFIFSSSCSVYGHGVDCSLTEDSPLAPVSLYARCKVEAEARLRAMGSDNFAVTVLRNATVYGPSRRMRYDLVLNLMTVKAFTDRVIYVLGGGKQWRPNVHVRDAARAVLAVMDQPVKKVAGQVFNVGANEQNFQVLDIAHIVRDVMPDVAIKVVPDDPDRRNYNVNFDRITRGLDFQVKHSLPEAVAEIKGQLTKGCIWSYNDPRSRTLEYYSWLLNAQRILSDVCLDGKLFDL